jgi:hypothetical protein
MVSASYLSNSNSAPVVKTAMHVVNRVEIAAFCCEDGSSELPLLAGVPAFASSEISGHNCAM